MDDLLSLHHSDQEIVQYFAGRFVNKMYFTWIGPVLVFVNPYTMQPELKSQQKKAEFWNDLLWGTLPKIQIFSMIKKAHDKILLGNCEKNQIIFLSGLNGSGKTVLSQIIVEFLASNPRLSAASILDLEKAKLGLMVLDIFGNASIKNQENSSRHGRLFSMRYHAGRVVPSLKTCCLELSRVTGSGLGKNFHIFFQILSECNEPEIAHLQLTADENFKIMEHPTTLMDHKNFLITIKILDRLGFAKEDRVNIFSVLGAILYLGNINFIFLNEVTVNTMDESSNRAIKRTSCLLGIEEIQLCDLLIMQSVKVPKSRQKYSLPTIIQSSSTEQSCNQRNSLMRFLYQSLFKFIEEKINSNWKVSNIKRFEPAFEILDPQGFQKNSETNDLEQLCVNFANEKLHYSFMQLIFTLNQKMLLDEENKRENYFSEINQIFPELSKCKELLDTFSPLWTMLDHISLEDYKTGKNHDLSAEILKNTPQRDKIIVNVLDKQFTVHHYSGSVKYDTKNMVKDNVTLVSEAMIAKLLKSNNLFLRKLLLRNYENKNEVTTKIRDFQVTLSTLHQKIQEADVYHVKCISSNNEQKPDLIHSKHLHRQLVSNGIIDLARTKLSKFPIIMERRKFESILVVIARHRNFQITENYIQYGKEAVYLTEKMSLRLLKEFEHCLAELILKVWKEYRMRKHFGAMQDYVRNLIHQTRSLRLEFEKISNADNPKEHNPSSESTCNCKGQQNNAVNLIDDLDGNRIKRLEVLPEKMLLNYLIDQKGIKVHGLIDYDILMGLKTFKSGPITFSQLIDLTKHFNPFLKTKRYKFGIFKVGRGIITKFALSKTPIRFHTRPTVLPFSHKLPHNELPSGIEDALSDEDSSHHGNH